MGFFVGWTYFDESERYSARHYREMAYERHHENIRKAKAEKKREKRRIARKKKKEEAKKKRQKQDDAYQKMALDQYNESDESSFGYSSGTDLYTKFSGEDDGGYQREVMRQHGQLYQSKENEGRRLCRMNGPQPSQEVKRKTSGQERGALARRSKIPLGQNQFNPFKEEKENHQKRFNRDGTRGSSSNDGGKGFGSGSDSGGTFSGKLNRPF